MKMKGTSLDPTNEKLKQLKQLLPEAFAEGKLDWEKLKASLGEDISFADERYVLNWAGKSNAFREIQMPTTKTLAPCKKESVDWDHTEHIFIEGENLDVLRTLQKSYYNKIKMIYIDPPYNTGNDSFIYPDNFSETKEEYLKRVGDKDEEGYMISDYSFSQNSKENGQYHSNWLNMMYPRLHLAKNLLKEDGVIFVSIDDNEVHNLRLMMNEIFGEENFVAQMIVQSNPGGRDYGGIALTHEYILIYSKGYGTELFLFEDKNKVFKHTDNLGGFDDRELRNRNVKFNIDNRPNLCYSFYVNEENKDKNGFYEVSLKPKANWIEVTPLISQGIQTVWRWGKPKSLENLNINVKAKKKQDGSFMIIEKYRSNLKRIRSILHKKSYRNEKGSLAVKELFVNFKPFDYPKSDIMIKTLIQLGSKNDDIILDFFSGSGTTAHAVMALNTEDGGNRKCISVQLAEETDEKSEAYKAGYKNIADISKERIQRAAKKIKKDNPLFVGDLGMKVFKLQESSFKQWQSNITDVNELEKQIKMFIDPVAENAINENMLYELLLKSGKDLNSAVLFKDQAYYINDNELVILLDKVSQDIIDSVLSVSPNKVLILDKLFKGNDQLKTNTKLQMDDAGIKFKTI